MSWSSMAFVVATVDERLHPIPKTRGIMTTIDMDIVRIASPTVPDLFVGEWRVGLVLAPSPDLRPLHRFAFEHVVQDATRMQFDRALDSGLELEGFAGRRWAR